MSTTFSTPAQALDDLERQASAEMLMRQALNAHPAADGDDPWDDPKWDTIVGLGAPLSLDECFEPEPEDWLDYNLYLERLEYERGCNARFA